MADYQAIVCTRFSHWRDLQVQRLARPPLAPGQVRMRVRHAGVGFAVSLFVSGKYQRKPPLPFTPGTEAAGTVIEVAPDVVGFAPGDRVIAALDWGAFGEEAVATAETVYPLPDGVDMGYAAALPLSYGTTWGALEWRAALRPGETLLVHGASGALGTAAVQIGRLMGARVIATASTEGKREAALRNGASHALPSDPATLAAAVKSLCPAGGVDVVYDPVGGDLFDASVRCCAPGGRILVIGFTSGRIPEVATNLLLLKNASVMGFNIGHYIGWSPSDERKRYATVVKELIGKVTGAFASGAMSAPNVNHFAFADWQDAIDAVMSRRAVGKVILDI